MTSPYLDNATRWCFALRTLMGYPEHAPPFHTTKWCSSGPRSLEQVMDLVQLARDMQCDVVHATFELDIDEPTAIALYMRRETSIEWMPNVLPYAASETAKIELLAQDRWHIGPRQLLTGAKLPPKRRWESGIALARHRWRQLAETIQPPQVAGSVWVPPGGSYGDAIPHAALKIAA